VNITVGLGIVFVHYCTWLSLAGWVGSTVLALVNSYIHQLADSLLELVATWRK